MLIVGILFVTSDTIDLFPNPSPPRGQESRPLQERGLALRGAVFSDSRLHGATRFTCLKLWNEANVQETFTDFMPSD